MLFFAACMELDCYTEAEDLPSGFTEIHRI
jgi:hypothetical protein